MGALTKPEAQAPHLAEVVEIDGHRVLRLPDGVRIQATQFHVTESLGSLRLEPVRRRLTEEEWVQWTADMRRFQEELGDLFPEGRNQSITEPKEIFPSSFFDEKLDA